MRIDYNIVSVEYLNTLTPAVLLGQLQYIKLNARKDLLENEHNAQRYETMMQNLPTVREAIIGRMAKKPFGDTRDITLFTGELEASDLRGLNGDQILHFWERLIEEGEGFGSMSYEYSQYWMKNRKTVRSALLRRIR